MIGYIYKIANLETDEIYIGSTFNMEERLISHKENYITWFNNNNNPYRQAFDILKYPSYYMELIEEVEVLTRLEMEIIEGQYQRENECVNIRKAGKTKETIFIQSQGYRLKYKDKIKERKGKVCICECGKEYTHDHKARHEKTQFHINFCLNK